MAPPPRPAGTGAQDVSQKPQQNTKTVHGTLLRVPPKVTSKPVSKVTHKDPSTKRKKPRAVVLSDEDEDHPDDHQGAPKRHQRASSPAIDHCKVIADLQQQVFELRNQVASSQLQDKEERLAAKIAQDAEDESISDDSDRGVNEREERKAFLKAALRYGKAFTAVICMWPPPHLFDMLDPRDIGHENFESDEDNYRCAAFFGTVHSKYHHLIHGKEFQARFLEGCSSIRAWFVHHIVVNHATIFDIENSDFRVKKKRHLMPEVIELLEDDHFLYDPLLQAHDRVLAFMRSKYLTRSMTLLLWGPASLANGGQPVKSKATNGKLWNLARVTAELIAFTATAVYFVLSCEEGLQEEGIGGVDFGLFYRNQISLLEQLATNCQDKYKDLHAFYNKILFDSRASGSEMQQARIQCDNALLQLIKAREPKDAASATTLDKSPTPDPFNSEPHTPRSLSPSLPEPPLEADPVEIAERSPSQDGKAAYIMDVLSYGEDLPIEAEEDLLKDQDHPTTFEDLGSQTFEDPEYQDDLESMMPLTELDQDIVPDEDLIAAIATAKAEIKKLEARSRTPKAVKASSKSQLDARQTRATRRRIAKK